MSGITEIIDEEAMPLFECQVCKKQMKDLETALRLKKDPKNTDEDAPRYSFCQTCVDDNEKLLEQQTFHSRMLVSRLLNTMSADDQEEFRLELQATDPKQYTIFENLFGHKRTLEVYDESGNVIERHENI